MTDRIEEILRKQIEHFHKAREAMETGKLRTHENGRDTTQESIEQNMVWTAELEEALERHRMRRGNS